MLRRLMRGTVAALALAIPAFSQTAPSALLVTTIPGITSSWAGECGPGVVDNRSVFTRQNLYHSVSASGTGTWSVTLQYSNTSCSGPWSAYGFGATINQGSSPEIAVGFDPPNSPSSYINIVVTGNAVANYAAENQLYLAPGTTGAGGIVTSVFGRGGTVTAQTGDYTTSQVTEGTNLYFTSARAVSAMTGLYQSPITTGTTAQYFRGDLSLATFPTSLSSFSNGPGYITGNQSITWTASGDVSGSASGSTSIGPSLTVTGLKGASLPSLATGNLRYNGGWGFDSTVYAPVASPTFTGTTTIPNLTLSGVTEYTQCLHANSSGVVSGVGYDCGAGGGGGGGGGGVVAMTTSSGPPTQGVGCVLPVSGTILTTVLDITNNNWWVSVAGSGNCWYKIPMASGIGPFAIYGGSGSASSGLAASRPTCSTASYYYATDTVALSVCNGTSWSSLPLPACIFNSGATGALQCYDASGDAGSLLPPSGTSIGNSTTGNAATATALASYPSLCTGTQFSQGLSSGSNNCATPSGGSGGTPNWVSGVVYYGGVTGGAPWPNIVQNAFTITAGTIYCVDAFDYPNLSPTEIFGNGGAQSGGTYYQTIAVLNSAGTVEMYATPIVMPSGGLAWEKWTVASGSISGGQANSYCTVTDSTATGPTWYGYGQAGTGTNWLNPGASGAYGSGPINWYTCSTAKTGSGSSLAIPQYGNCPAGHGTRTAVPTNAAAPMAMLMNQ